MKRLYLTSVPVAWALTYCVASAVSAQNTRLGPEVCGTAWHRVPSPSPAHQSGDANQLSGVAVFSATDAWAVGWSLSFSGLGYKTLAEHWDGTRWSVVPTANTAMRNNTLRAVSVLAPDDVWAVGQQDDGSGNAMTLVEHWDGYRWRVDPSATVPGSLGAVIAFSSTDVWVSGFVLEHWDGTRWTVTDIGAANYLGSLVGSSRDLWAAGYRTIQPFGPVLTLSYHWDGAAWTAHRAVDPLTDSRDDEDVLVGMTVAPGDTHPWAVGYFADFDGGPPAHTLVEQWDGAKWNRVRAPNPGGASLDNELFAVEARSPSDVWVVGTIGSDGSSNNQTLILRWDGTGWTVAPNTGTGVLVGMGVDRATGNLWAVGYSAETNYQGTLILASCEP